MQTRLTFFIFFSPRTSAAQWQTAQPPASPQWPYALWCLPASVAPSSGKVAARSRKFERYAERRACNKKYMKQNHASSNPFSWLSPFLTLEFSTSNMQLILNSCLIFFLFCAQVNRCSGTSGRRHAPQLHRASHHHRWHSPVDNWVCEADLCGHAWGKCSSVNEWIVK